MRRLIACLFVIANVNQAFALNDTIAVTVGTGTTKTANLVSFAGGNVISEVAGCDSTTANQCWIVDSSGRLSTLAIQPTAANLNATVVGTGTFATQLTGATNNINNISGTISLPTGAATSANQTNASQKTQIVDGSGNVIASTSNAMNVNVNNANANGQATMANSSPVVIASNQSNLPVNTAQVNGVTVLTGTGATGTGAQRVTVSTDQATNAGAALVKGGVGVVNGGSFRQEVDASATATVLQSSTGAAGDYLSHCVIFPATTTPGVVQVFDNTNAGGNYAINFPGGASSVSNLAPIPVPVGAVSVGGAWKVTTTTNVSVVCYGKFS